MNAVIIRALKTFVQAFLAAWVLTVNSVERNALIGAAAAGISAVMNLLVQPSEG